MARPLRIRIEFPGGIYNLTARGNARRRSFEDDRDRDRLLSILQQAVERFNRLYHVYCLVDNHYHLVVKTGDGNLPQEMRYLNGGYTGSHNERYGPPGRGIFPLDPPSNECPPLDTIVYLIIQGAVAQIPLTGPSGYSRSTYPKKVEKDALSAN